MHATRPAAAAGLPVLLYALPEAGSPGVREGVADAQGRFVFSNVSNDPGTVYLIGARVGEVPFGVRVRFAGGELEHAAELPDLRSDRGSRGRERRGGALAARARLPEPAGERSAYTAQRRQRG